MGPEQQHQPSSYPLRLSASVLTAVRLHARDEGVSINHFIELALVEKLARLETAKANRAVETVQQQAVPPKATAYPARTLNRDAAVGAVAAPTAKKSLFPPDVS